MHSCRSAHRDTLGRGACVCHVPRGHRSERRPPGVLRRQQCSLFSLTVDYNPSSILLRRASYSAGEISCRSRKSSSALSRSATDDEFVFVGLRRPGGSSVARIVSSVEPPI